VRIAETIDNNKLLVSPLLSYSRSQHFHDQFLIIQNWTVFSLVEFISHLVRHTAIFISFCFLEQLAPLGIIFNILLNDLESRNIDHIELDC
jgi:hypothetical protein